MPDSCLAAVAACALHRGPARLQPGDRHSERRARDVVETDMVEEVHRLWVAPVFTAHTDFEIGPGLAALLGGDLYEAADALGVERLERAYPENAEVDVAAEERALDVVAGEAPAHLREVVGAEGEELRR